MKVTYYFFLYKPRPNIEGPTFLTARTPPDGPIAKSPDFERTILFFLVAKPKIKERISSSAFYEISLAFIAAAAKAFRSLA